MTPLDPTRFRSGSKTTPPDRPDRRITMEPAEYNRLRRFETWYWWYLAQRENVLEAIRELRLPREARVFDAGCGTGGNLEAVLSDAPVRGYGADVSPLAASHWGAELQRTGCVASVNDLPYADEVFDLVYSVDVLGCRGVDPGRALNEMARVLRRDGALVLLLPAFQWLRSAHDEAVHSERRYTVESLKRVVQASGFRVLKAGYRFSLFFPMIAAVRLARKRRVGGGSPESDLAPIPSWLNTALLNVSRLDHCLCRRVPLPFGSTVLLVARKEAG